MANVELIQKREREVIEFIRSEVERTGISPTNREISFHLYGHEDNAGNIHKMIQRLLREGKLSRAVARTGALRVAE